MKLHRLYILLVLQLASLPALAADTPGAAAAAAKSPPAADATASPAKPAKAADPVDYAPVLTRVIEAQARAILERHVAPEAYQIFVSIKAKPAPTSDIAYMPDGVTPSGLAALPVEALSVFIQQMDIEVLLADRYKKMQNQLQTILERKLSMDKARGDKVTFSKLAIDLPLPKSELELTLAKEEADARDLKGRYATLAKERDDIKRDLSLAKSELEKAERTVKDAVKEAGKSKEATSLVDQLKSQLPILAACVIVLIAVLLASFVIRGAAKTMSAAVRSIGDGLPQLGDKLSEGMAAKTGGVELPTVNAKQLESASSDGGSGGGGGGRGSSSDSPLSALPLEALHARIILLHEELVATLRERGEQAEALLLRHTSTLLDQGDQSSIGLAVATLEILGQDLANTLFQKLGPDQQRAAMDFLSRGRHERPKAEVMLEAGEALKTKLMLAGAAGSGRARLSDKVAELLMQFSTADLVGYLETGLAELLPRLFLYLEAGRLGDVLSELAQRNRDKFVAVSQAVAKMPQAEAAVNFDEELAKALAEHLAKVREDTQRPYLNFYKLLVEAVDDQVAEALSATIAAEGPSVEQFIRENIITFGVFFQLQPSIQEELTDALSTKDLAALLAGLGEAEKGKIASLLDDKRRDLVQEEVDRLTSRGARQVQAAHRQAKQGMVARILAMKGDGALLDLLASGATGAGGTPSAGDSGAAKPSDQQAA